VWTKVDEINRLAQPLIYLAKVECLRDARFAIIFAGKPRLYSLEYQDPLTSLLDN
jgi:hypothetical protein